MVSTALAQTRRALAAFWCLALTGSPLSAPLDPQALVADLDSRDHRVLRDRLVSRGLRGQWGRRDLRGLLVQLENRGHQVESVSPEQRVTVDSLGPLALLDQRVVRDRMDQQDREAFQAMLVNQDQAVPPAPLVSAFRDPQAPTVCAAKQGPRVPQEAPGRQACQGQRGH